MSARRPNIAHTALTLGVVGSLAFNVAWAWPSPVLVGVGVLMAFTLPTAVALWRASGELTGWPRTERALVMGFIAAGAGLYTAVHATLLLHDAGLPWAIAWLPALVGEALVVMAARADTPAVSVREKSRQKATPRSPAKKPVSPDPAPPQSPPAVSPGQSGGDESPEDRKRRQAADRQARRRQRQREERTAA
ncbi:hypothetical protein [Pseudonocardia parietis]|uniref:DUF2637 domain-containing protein n=1 Tax=Pseudonocardia parietis TaxID=570936 RepID=A0ABS4W214_9PSEU|nr:hypothetical protein [Pseudonocardia parietis]MBP2370246.1 hypothetical protein [Pseudonocardia parietis]